ncbi:MAG: metallophosphoesterase [Rickettsiales bacterium]|nr:metallophosphoesterase [Rickettsiales bacterium]
MKLLAISDLHVRHKSNRQALLEVSARPDDWLILCGDLGESPDHLRLVFETLGPRFARLIWVPGNHELWSRASGGARGVDHYLQLVELCRSYQVLTPEDPYVLWQGEGGPAWLVPLFLLYDYSFRPAGMNKQEGLAWAAEAGIMCTDEFYLHPHPYPSREDWCQARLALSEERLSELDLSYPTILINHFQLRFELARLPRVPRFCLWCGTTRTEDWHQRWNAKVVVSGHLHMRSTDWRDGTRFEEVALGYPRDWQQSRGIDGYLREILPGPQQQLQGRHGPVWHR